MTDMLTQLFQSSSEIKTTSFQRLVKLSVQQIGLTSTLDKLGQWKKLAKKLNTASKMSCLGDYNHQLLLLEFIKADAVDIYSNSYFNKAKIDKQYLDCIRQVGPYLFTEIIMVVSKLTLIAKHFSDYARNIISQNHIDIKISHILELCRSKKRSVSSNLNKFKMIVECGEQREQLTKELGKMLRTAWAIQKKKEKDVQQEDLIGVQGNNAKQSEDLTQKRTSFIDAQRSKMWSMDQTK